MREVGQFRPDEFRRPLSPLIVMGVDQLSSMVQAIGSQGQVCAIAVNESSAGDADVVYTLCREERHASIIMPAVIGLRLYPII